MMKGYKLVVSFDNEDNTSSQKTRGWVDDFCNYLQIFVTRLSSHEIKVINKSKAKENEVSGDGKFIYVPVISPNYLTSDTAKKELSQFIASGHPIFRVQKSPIDTKNLPGKLSQLLSYNFYERSVDTENEYALYNANSFNKNYWLKLVDLAYDIVQSIAISEEQNSKKDGKVVFLAETTFDQESSRDTLKRELQRYGHTVLPDHPLPEDPALLEKEITQYLEKSSVAIHIVGAFYGHTINGTDLSLVEFQNNIASNVTQKRFEKENTILKRYLWSPPYMRPADEKQMLYIDQLKEEVDRSTNAEIIQVPLEILKSILENNLEELNNTKAAVKQVTDKKGSKIIYLVFDKEDTEDIASLKKQLEKENFEILTPAFEGDQMSLLNSHRSNLVKSDAVLIYSNRSNHFWLTSKINDIIKSPGFGKVRPFLAQAICTPSYQVEASRVAGYNDLLKLENLNPDSINSFLGKLK